MGKHEGAGGFQRVAKSELGKWSSAANTPSLDQWDAIVGSKDRNYFLKR